MSTSFCGLVYAGDYHSNLNNGTATGGREWAERRNAGIQTFIRCILYRDSFLNLNYTLETCNLIVSYYFMHFRLWTTKDVSPFLRCVMNLQIQHTSRQSSQSIFMMLRRNLREAVYIWLLGDLPPLEFDKNNMISTLFAVIAVWCQQYHWHLVNFFFFTNSSAHNI